MDRPFPTQKEFDGRTYYYYGCFNKGNVGEHITWLKEEGFKARTFRRGDLRIVYTRPKYY